MKRLWCLAMVLLVGVAVSSCSTEKTAATGAIQAAETAWSAVKDNVMKLMPAEGKSIEDAIAGARTSLENGDAKAALAAAKGLPARIQQLAAGLAARETELRGAWEAMAAVLPGSVNLAQAKIDALDKTRRLPAGVDKAAFDGAKDELARARQGWADAQAAEQSGNLADALARATEVRTQVTEVLNTLKVRLPAGLSS